MAKEKCLVGCGRTTRSKNLCINHYLKARRMGMDLGGKLSASNIKELALDQRSTGAPRKTKQSLKVSKPAKISKPGNKYAKRLPVVKPGPVEQSDKNFIAQAMKSMKRANEPTTTFAKYFREVYGSYVHADFETLLAYLQKGLASVATEAALAASAEITVTPVSDMETAVEAPTECANGVCPVPTRADSDDVSL